MNINEHALAVLIEECAEVIQCASKVQQAATKALRFGIDSGCPGSESSNRSDLVLESNDLIGALEHLMERQNIQGLFNRKQIERKKERIRDWHQHAFNNGTLQ